MNNIEKERRNIYVYVWLMSGTEADSYKGRQQRKWEIHCS